MAGYLTIVFNYLYILNPLDPMDLPSSMRYFPRISPNSLKISPKVRGNIQSQSTTHAYIFIIFIIFIKTKSILKKCGKIWKNGRFSGRLRPDWGDTARAATAGLGSIGLNDSYIYIANKDSVSFPL